MNINWFWVIVLIVIMTAIGFTVFDNIGASLAFGVICGGIFGLLFSSKKQTKHKVD